MKPSKEQIQALARSTLDTRPVELTCDEWLEKAARYVELVLAGAAIPAELRLVEEHLRLCPECTEEFEALRKSLMDG